jgi:hypothetical protein
MNQIERESMINGFIKPFCRTANDVSKSHEERTSILGGTERGIIRKRSHHIL